MIGHEFDEDREPDSTTMTIAQLAAVLSGAALAAARSKAAPHPVRSGRGES